MLSGIHHEKLLTMTNKAFLILLFLSFGVLCYAQGVQDSTKKAETPKAQLKATVRLHTRGMFLYGGRISTDNPALDFNFTYNRPQWGFFIYKAIDLKDHTSLNNFLLAALYKNFKLSNKITFTPYIGTFLEQAHSFADWGSDVVAIAMTTFKVNTNFSIDYTILLPNLVVEPELLDWVNRTRILFASKHLEIIASYWHNNHVFDEQDHMSGALNINYSRVRLSDSFNLSVGATEFIVFQSSDEETIPTTNRFLITLAVQFVK